jgi:predicted Zn-dependent protease
MVENTNLGAASPADAPLRAGLSRSLRSRSLRIIGAAFAAAFLLAATGCLTPLESGKAAFSEGQYAQAKQHAREGLREEPDDASLNLLMAQTLVARESYRAAESYAVKAFEAGEDPVEAGRTLGKIHWELGRALEAVEAWSVAREASPDSVADSDFQRALEAAISTAMTLQQFETALELREQLAKLDPGHPEVAKQALRTNREQLAQAHVRDGEYEEAVEMYRRLLEAFPDHGSYAMSMGRHLIRLDRGDEAIEAFTAYIDGAKEASRVTHILEVARLAESMKAREVAVHFYVAALEEMEGQPSFRRAKLNLTLAGIYFNQQQAPRAIEHIERYLTDMTQLRGLPLNAEVYVTAADTASEHNQPTYALELLEQGLEKAPPSWHVASKLASLYARRARSGEMERVLTAYVERAEDSAEAKLQVARWALNRRNYDLAQHFFERALEDDGTDRGVWLELARVYSTLGVIDRLEHALDAYVKKSDHGRYELIDVAEIYQKHRLYEQAEEVLLQARKDDPKSLVAVDRLAQLYTDWGKPAKLHSYYESWVQARGGEADDYQLVGERFVRQGRPNEALPYLEKAAQKGSHQSWLQMADVYSRQRRDIDMKRALERYMQSAPRTASAMRSVLSRYRSAGMNSEAVEVLEQLIELEPGVLSHYQQLSRFYFEQGRENDAVDLWTRYLDQSDRPIETLETIAQWFQRRGQPQWILTIYRRLLQRGDADPHIYRLVGDTYLMIDQRSRQMGSRAQQSVSLSDPQKQAERFYELYLDKASPQRSELIDFADSMRRQEMWDIAARIYARLAEGEAKASKLWFNYAQVLLHVGSVAEAEAMIKRYYQERDENVEDARVIAETLVEAGRYSAAEPYLDKMFASEQPTYVQGAFRRLAQLYLATERSEQIPKLLQTFLERAQNPTKARQEILAVLQNAGMYAEAAEQIERIRTFQGDVMGFQLAENLFRAGQTDKAEAAFSKYSSKNAYPGDAWVTVGDFYARHGAGKLAKNAYQKSVRAAPDNAKTHNALGRFLILNGDVKAGREALALARKKMALVQREEVIRVEMETLVQVGRNSEARALAEEALGSASRHKDYFQHLIFDYDLATQGQAKAQRTIQELAKSSVSLRDKIDMLSKNGFREEAAKLIEDEIANGDRYTASQIVRERSDLLTSLGGFERLEKAIKPLLEQPHEGSRQQAQIGEYFVSQGEYQRGIPYLRSAIAQGHVEFRSSLAHAYAALGYHKEALRVHQRLLESVNDVSVTDTLRAIGVQYEVHGQPQQFLKLLRVLSSDGRYAAKAAPMLAKLLAEDGRIDEASSVIVDSMSQPGQKVEDAEAMDVVIDAHRDDDVETLAGSLEALAGEGYVDEARGLLSNLSAELRAEDRLQTLALNLAVVRSKESAEEHATGAVADFELSQGDNLRRLQVAELLRSHGLYELADKLAARGLENLDYTVNWGTARFLIGNAYAANKPERLDALAKSFVTDAQDKIAAKSDLAEHFRRLGLDERAVDTSVSVARANPVRKHVVDALMIAQGAGDREQLDAMTDLYMRVGRDPLTLLNSLLTRWTSQQEPTLTRPLLARYQAVYPAVFNTRMMDIELTFREGDVEQARAKLGELLEFVDYDPYSVHRIVFRLNRAGLFVETARVVAPKLEGRAINAHTQLLVGSALQDLGLEKEAAARFDLYIEASSDEALAATKIAQEMLGQDQLEQVGAFADLAVQKDPERPEPYFFRGVARLHSGDSQAARRDLDRSIGSGVNRTYGLYNAAYHALKAGEDVVAAEYLNQLAKTASPEDPEVPLRLVIQCFIEAERAQDGIAFFEEHFPTVAAGTGILGEALIPQTSGLYEAAGHHERAFGLYESAINDLLVRDPTVPGLVVYFNNLAYTFSTTNKQLDRGFDLVRRAIASGVGRNPSYLDTLGWLHYRRGELDAAETHIGRSLRTANGGQAELKELYEHLIAIKRAKGQSREALWLEVYLENLR